MAAIIGFHIFVSLWMPPRAGALRVAETAPPSSNGSSFMSWPAEKAREPQPVIMPTQMSGLSRISLNAS